MLSPHTRIISDKENADTVSPLPFDSPTGTSKPRVSGFGRAPKRSTAHSLKPYARGRTTSIQRAKVHATRKHVPAMLKLGKVDEEISGKRRRLRQPDRVLYIPLQLPKPAIPLVGYIDCRSSSVPAEYVLARLRPFLASLFVVTQLYRPQPQYNLPYAPIPYRRPTMAFAIPTMLKEGGMDKGLQNRIRGMEPDVCLAVTRKGGPAGQVPRIYAVSEVVLKAYCAYWPKFSTTESIREDPERGRSLDTVSEGKETSDLGNDTDSESDSDTIVNASFDSDSTIQTTPEHNLHLPIISLPLPSPEMFPILLVHLHTPSRPLLPKLLGLRPSCTGRAEIITELGKATIPEMMAKLAHVHAVWKNVVALGMSDTTIWGEMSGAWSCLVSVVAGIGGGTSDRLRQAMSV